MDEIAVREVLAEFRRGPMADRLRDAIVSEAADRHLASVVLRLVQERLLAGEIAVTVRDGIKAAKLLASSDVERSALRSTVEHWRQIEEWRTTAMDRLLSIVGEVCGTESLSAVIGASVNDDAVGPMLMDQRLAHHLAVRRCAA